MPPGAGAPEHLRGGELNAAVTRAIVGIQTESLGRGPNHASTFHHEHVIVTLLHNVLTQAERTLAERQHGDAVQTMRALYQQTMEPAFRDAVERLSGRKVIAFVSGNHVEPDIAAEIFILDAPL